MTVSPSLGIKAVISSDLKCGSDGETWNEDSDANPQSQVLHDGEPESRYQGSDLKCGMESRQ